VPVVATSRANAIVDIERFMVHLVGSLDDLVELGCNWV
jgi:hypothetical protein